MSSGIMCATDNVKKDRPNANEKVMTAINDPWTGNIYSTEWFYRYLEKCYIGYVTGFQI